MKLPSIKLPSISVPTLTMNRKEPEPEPDPFANVEYTDNYETDAALEMSETLRRFKDHAAAEQLRQTLATDTEFWFAVYFKDRAQKEAFLRGLGLDLEEDGDKYIDGVALARRLGIELPEVSLPPGRGRIDPAFAALSLGDEGGEP